MIELTHCILTNYQFENSKTFDGQTGFIIEYEFQPVGKVRIALPTLMGFINTQQYLHPVLAGICRNAFENNTEPPLITREFISNNLKNISYPKTFKEKYRHFLKYVYDKGGNDFKEFDFNNASDYPICFAENIDEFSKILKYLNENYLIQWHSEMSLARGIKRYLKVQLTDGGISEVEKDLPNIPLIGLVDQKIATGDTDTDNKINHAKDLFFEEPQSLDRMRSACETLIFILEPLRQDVKKYINSKDTQDFFNVVNNFDIRHNKESTKSIEHPEQLEWIFYSLLNTINTYTKLKLRLGR